MKEKNIIKAEIANGFVIVKPGWYVPVKENGLILVFQSKKEAGLWLSKQDKEKYKHYRVMPVKLIIQIVPQYR